MYFQIEYSLGENVGIAANHHSFVEGQFMTAKVVDIDRTYVRICGIKL